MLPGAVHVSASKVIHCCHCGGPVRVSTRAISVSCPHCHQRVALESVVVRGPYSGRSLITCGDVLIEETGRVTVPVRAQNVTVHGIIKAPVVAIDTLNVASSGRIFGDVQAGRLNVADGGSVAGACRIVSSPRPSPAQQADGPARPAPVEAALPSTLPTTQHGSSAPVLRPVPHNPVRRPRGV